MKDLAIQIVAVIGSILSFFVATVLVLASHNSIDLSHSGSLAPELQMVTCSANDHCYSSMQDTALAPSNLSPNLLLILIFSSAVGEEAKEKRDAIRATWVKDLSIDLQDSSSIYYR